MKHKVALILPYFGILPNYFPLWLKSAGVNRDFTFMLFTDADLSGYNVPDNVKVIPMTLDGVKKLIAPHLDFEFSLETPYKLCDYKPLYGLIFQDWLKGYDFWGHVDPDIIWGKLDSFITDDLLDKYGRLYRRGHFTLYRNTPGVNSFALHKLPYWNISYRDIYRIDNYIGLDEQIIAEHLFSNFAVDGGGGMHNMIALIVQMSSLYFLNLSATSTVTYASPLRHSGG